MTHHVVSSDLISNLSPVIYNQNLAILKLVAKQFKIDEKTLQDIATITDGKYFRATNNSSLKKIYDDIDKLEKSKIEVTEFHKRNEEYLIFALTALILLISAFILETFYFKKII